MDAMLKQQNGQTLVEVVIAIAILAFAMAAAGALATVTTRSSTESGRRTQADALANREMESLRSLQESLVEAPGSQDTLYGYLRSPQNDTLSSGSGCFQFVMHRDQSTPTGWNTEAPDSVDTPIKFTGSDFNNPDAFEGYSNFSRLIKLCTSRTWNAEQNRYESSNHIYDTEVLVIWREADDVPRKVRFRSIIATPEHADGG